MLQSRYYAIVGHHGLSHISEGAVVLTQDKLKVPISCLSLCTIGSTGIAG